ncbi:hypothetical protein WA158_002517 [Blastocystis sp. Blastoise]
MSSSNDITRDILEKYIPMTVKNNLLFDIHVKPNSKKCSIEFEDGCLNLKIASQPTEGKANKEVCETLSSILQVPKRQIAIAKGEKSRDKTISIQGIERSQVIDKIYTLLHDS